MQAVMGIAPSPIPSSLVKKASKPAIFRPKLRRSSIKATVAPSDSSTVDYNSAFSVFPAEACETIGGEACWEGMLPEAKLPQGAKSEPSSAASEEGVDREYLEYNEPKTVFRAEACDDLGGEFCDPDYQKEVF